MNLFHLCCEALGISWYRIYLADSLADRYASSGTRGNFEDLRWLILHLAVQAGRGHMRSDLHALEEDFSSWYVLPEEGKVPGFDIDLPARLATRREVLIQAALNSGLVGRLAENDTSADSLPVPRPPLVLSSDGRHLYFLRRRREEDRLLASLEELCAPGVSPGFPAPSILPDEPAGELMKRLSAGRRLLILSGGPGTGKTTTVARLLGLIAEGRIESEMNPAALLLAAPTGRAAARMSEGLGDLPEDMEIEGGRTLHGLLGLSPNRPPKYNRENPLNTDLVIVDEASMVDLPMMNLLLDALPPSASLLLVGDPDQLPSVEAGALLGDLLAGAGGGETGPLKDAVVHLTRVFRSSTAILEAASAVRRGNLEELLSAGSGGGVRLQPMSDPEKTARIIADGYRDVLESLVHDNTTLLSAYGVRAVLTPLRKGPWGVPALNDLVSLQLGGTTSPFAGMPVMITSNDSSRGVWNGDRGILILREGRLRALLPVQGGARTFPLAALPGWEPAWVQTIHKSQGSEFDRVTVLLPRGADRLLTREILYTAFTRARKRVDLYADEPTVKAALAGRVLRHSRVSDWASGAS